MQRCTWKTKLLGTSSEGLFQTPSNRISHRIHIVRTSCSQLPVRSWIFCLLVKVIYWPCGLKSEYATINLAFLGIIIKLNFLRNFACTVLNDFVSKKVGAQNIFPLLSRSLRSMIYNCYCLLSSNLKQKEHNIIIRKILAVTLYHSQIGICVKST